MQCPHCKTYQLFWRPHRLIVKPRRHYVGERYVDLVHLYCGTCDQWAYPQEHLRSAKRLGLAHMCHANGVPSPAQLRTLRFYGGFHSAADFGEVLGIPPASYRNFETDYILGSPAEEAVFDGTHDLVKKIKEVNSWPW